MGTRTPFLLSLGLALASCGGDGSESNVPIPLDAGADRSLVTEDAGPRTDADPPRDAGLDARLDATDAVGDVPTNPPQDANSDPRTPSEGGTDAAPDALADVMSDVPRDSRSEAVLAYAKALCRLHARCASYAMEVQFGSESTCVERTLLLDWQQFPVGPGAAITPTEISTCASALEALSSCDARINGSYATLCAFSPGSLKDGSTCFANAQCATGYCNGGSATGCGQCTAKAKSGTPCSPGYTMCADGLVCGVWNASDLGESPSCRKARNVGETCDKDNLCVGSLVCSNGVCKKPIESVGSGCDTSATKNACSGLTGLRCDKTTGTCTEVAALSVAGEDCGSSLSGVLLCEGDLYCDSSTKRCVARGKDGEFCDSSSFSNTCLPNSRCVSNKCAPVSAPSCP